MLSSHFPFFIIFSLAFANWFDSLSAMLLFWFSNFGLGFFFFSFLILPVLLLSLKIVGKKPTVSPLISVI